MLLEISPIRQHTRSSQIASFIFFLTQFLKQNKILYCRVYMSFGTVKDPREGD